MVKRINIAAGMSLALAILCAAEARAQKPPLLPQKDVAALANEVSGETAKRNLEGIARFHRQRGSKEFHEAAELVAERLRAYGLSDAAILQFPADGKIFYGTQRSRSAWDAESAELDIMQFQRTVRCGPSAEHPNIIADCFDGPTILHESFGAEPVVLAEDSEGEGKHTVGTLIYVGEGTKDSDYSGRDVKGKIVLVSAQPGAVQDLAVGKYGAVGIISYAQNQKTAWWGENENLIRWGHLDTFSPNKTWAFMVSLRTGRELRDRLAHEQVLLVHANVKAGQHSGNYEVVTATIPGADPKLKDEEIVFSCHLDHERPGANDNASGCAAILEVARTLQKLINEGRLQRPARTIWFVFPPEIEGTMALLSGHGYMSIHDEYIGPNGQKMADDTDGEFFGPRVAKWIKAVIHMDMVGGGPETKAVFHVTRGPMSLPSFVHDVAWAFADWVNEESYKFAATGKADYPMVAPEGGKEPLRAEYSAFTMGSDHDVYQDSSFGIPAIYLNDWPDRYIHTNFDSAANIDPTKLKRAAFIGAASGYYLSRLSPDLVRQTVDQVESGNLLLRLRREKGQSAPLNRDQACAMAFNQEYENRMLNELEQFVGSKEEYIQLDGNSCPNPEGSTNPTSKMKYARKAEPKGPLAVFGYDYFLEHAKAAGIATPKLLSYQGLWGAGEEYAYEVLNFADGKRNAQEIRDAVSAEYGPVPLEMVVEYLKALEKIGILEEVKKQGA